MSFEIERKKRAILISSSSDLFEARKRLSDRIRTAFNDLRIEIEIFLWEEETKNGTLLGAGTPVQRQIDQMLFGRLTMTLVMFGERIGEPLRGDPPDETATILREWHQFGLRHPWPNDPEEQWTLLREGCFPLTGTVYELLVGLKIAEENPDFALFIGYVADREVTTTIESGPIRFNQEKLFNTSDKPPANSDELDSWLSHVYKPQIQGIINLINALGKSRHGCIPPRHHSDDIMAENLASTTISNLLYRLAKDAADQILKPDLSHYSVQDPLPLPDRTDLRETIKDLLYTEGRKGHMLALRGPSGCGKSSLLQKGLLGDLPNNLESSIVVALRPTDLASRSETTPLLRLLGALADALDAAGLAGLRNLYRPEGTTNASRLQSAVDCLDRALRIGNRNLVLGMDQFEEVLDFASLDTEPQRESAASWWQVLRFLGKASKLARVWTAATLEKQRERRLEEMGIDRLAELQISTVNVDFPVSAVEEFVSQVAKMKGMVFHRDTTTLIMRMVEDFEEEKQRGASGRSTASFLPLLSIWLHRLFILFDDRASTGQEGVSSAFGGEQNIIRPDDLKERNVELKLGPLVESLVRDAWEEVGLAGEADSGAAPDPIGLDNFLSGLVSIDLDDNMQLTAIARKSDLDSVSRLVESHLKRRLLEPVGQDQVRLVHQAVVDNWPPAREWYRAQTRNLKRIREMRHVERMHRSGQDLEQLAATNPALVSEAAAILCLKRAAWGRLESRADRNDDGLLQEFCLALVKAAPHGALQYAVDDYTAPIIVEAARYDLEEPLDRWLKTDPDLIHWTNSTGESLLHKAAWHAPKATRVLLKHGTQAAMANSDGYHPIAAAIQTGCMDVLKQLLPAYAGPAAIVGPRGTTMLHYASGWGDRRTFGHLLNHSSDVDIITQDGLTPLHYASVLGSIENLNALLNSADFHRRDRNSENFIHHATSNDHGQVIESILEHPRLTDSDVARLLSGEQDEAPNWRTPIALAAQLAKPNALATLLKYCDPSAGRHHFSGEHPIVQVFSLGHGEEVSVPQADRMTACVRLLLDDGRLTADDAYKALCAAGQLPAAHRLIQNWLFEKGYLDELGDDVLFDWMTGPEVQVALRVLRKRPQLLDHRDQGAETGASRLLRDGHAAVLAVALREGLSPKDRPGLFRLEAALAVIASAMRAEGQDGAGNRRDPLAEIDPSTLHPVIAELRSDADSSAGQALLGMVPYGGLFSLLHRLAARNELQTFDRVLSGLTDPLPLDAYGRPPSGLAPPGKRQDFIALETRHSEQVAHP